jgi:hypothetical protein
MDLTWLLASAVCATGLLAVVLTLPQPRRAEAVARKRQSR